jgi:hypothetical protein
MATDENKPYILRQIRLSPHPPKILNGEIPNWIAKYDKMIM